MALRITIHQPNLCPYDGFWSKVRESDLLIILAHVQFPKGGYVNRFNHKGKWHTMSVDRGLNPIKDKEYINAVEDWMRIESKFPQLEVFRDCISPSLLATNSKIIFKACEILGIETKIKFDFETHLKGSERLLEICEYYGATEYISGQSGKNYLDLKLFEKSGINVIFNEPKSHKSLIEII